MEPRLISRGNKGLAHSVVNTIDASMEPRLISRGNANAVSAATFSAVLQWSRG